MTETLETIYYHKTLTRRKIPLKLSYSLKRPRNSNFLASYPLILQAIVLSSVVLYHYCPQWRFHRNRNRQSPFVLISSNSFQTSFRDLLSSSVIDSIFLRSILDPNPRLCLLFSFLSHRMHRMIYLSSHKIAGKAFKSLCPFFYFSYNRHDTWFVLISCLDFFDNY